MTTLAPTLASLATIATLTAASLVAAGCDTADPTSAVVDNGFPAVDADLPETYVYKVWWSVTLFADPVAPGGSSDVNRVVAGREYAYALLAPHWSPSLGAPPAQLIAVKTKHPITAARGDAVHIVIADGTIDGDCAADSHLSQADADLITTAIFPGDFAGATYDPGTCTVTAIAPADAGQSDDASAVDAGAND